MKYILLIFWITLAIATTIIGFPKALSAADNVDLTLITAAAVIEPEDIFDLIIQAESGNQEVVGVDVYLDFDSAKLAAVDMNSSVPGVQISPGSQLSSVLWNSVNNSDGHIDYSAGAFSHYPNGTFTVATIRFKAIATMSSTTIVNFSTSFARPTVVIGDTHATNVTGQLTGCSYSLITKITPAPSTNNGGNGNVDRNKAIGVKGLSSSSTLLVNGAGITQNSVRFISSDGRISLVIKAGTKLQNSTGYPLMVFEAESAATIPAVPAPNVLISAIAFGPIDGTFSPPATLTISYDPILLTEGVDENELQIAFYDETSWIFLESLVDVATSTVTADISYFGVYALLEKVTPKIVVSPTTTPTTTGEYIATPAPSVTIESKPPLPNDATIDITSLTPTVVLDIPSSVPASSAHPRKWPASVVYSLSGIAIIGIVGLIAILRKKKIK